LKTEDAKRERSFQLVVESQRIKAAGVGEIASALLSGESHSERKIEFLDKHRLTE
jgi:hypothetical protein